MGKYSSVLFGAEHYEKIGPFRFPVWHELVPGEIRGFERLSKKQARSTFRSIKLAQKIGAERGISTQEAIDLLSQLSSEDNEELVYQYAEELDEIQSGTLSEHDQKIEAVTLFMKYRGEVRLPDAKDYTPTNDWEMDDTENMPSHMLDQIYEFIESERTGKQKEGNEKPQASARRGS